MAKSGVLGFEVDLWCAMIVGVVNAALRVGLPVEVVLDDVTPKATLPRFKPR